MKATPPSDPRIRAALDAYAHALALELIRDLRGARMTPMCVGPAVMGEADKETRHDDRDRVPTRRRTR